MPETGTCPAFSTILGGCIAAAVGFGVAWWKRGQDGRDRFHAVMAEMLADMEDRRSYLKEFHTQSLPKIRSAIYAVQPFLCADRFDRVQAIWRDYKKLDDQQLDWGISYTKHHLQSADTPGRTQPADECLRDYFHRFKKEVRSV